MMGEETEAGVKPHLLYSNPQHAQLREKLNDFVIWNPKIYITHVHVWCVCIGSRHRKVRQKKASGKCCFSHLHGYYRCSS